MTVRVSRQWLLRGVLELFWLLRWQDTSGIEATSRDPSLYSGEGGEKGRPRLELVGGRDALADELLEELDVERRVVS